MVPPTPSFKIEMIEVKPMEMPVGALFYMDFKYKFAAEPYAEEDPYETIGGEG
jgi:hypothetical protein